MSTLDHTDTPAASEYATVYVAFELSKRMEARRAAAGLAEVEPIRD